MSRPPKRFVPASSEKPKADFNWPPADEELTQRFINAPVSPVPDAEPVVLPETLAQPPAHAEFDCTLNDVGPTRADAEDLSTSGVAVAQNATALEGASPGEWVAEIARLQELIEGLTQKLEWRIKSVER